MEGMVRVLCGGERGLFGGFYGGRWSGEGLFGSTFGLFVVGVFGD